MIGESCIGKDVEGSGGAPVSDIFLAGLRKTVMSLRVAKDPSLVERLL